jgi:hypothetical protein
VRWAIALAVALTACGHDNPPAPTDAGIPAVKVDAAADASPSTPVEPALCPRDQPPATRWSGNCHLYQVVVEDELVTEDQAVIKAVVAGGHLVTITSQAEGEFVGALLGNAPPFNGQGFWAGGIRTQPSKDPHANWQWVTKEPWGYTNWMAPDPDNAGGVENYLYIDKSSGWHDIQSDGNIYGYIVEIE